MDIAPEALAAAIYDIERELAGLGWNQAPSLFALVPTRFVLEQGEALDEESKQKLTMLLESSPDNLTAVLQENVSEDIGDMLARIEWPPMVEGAAVAMERIIVPPQVEAEAPEDPQERTEFLMSHPDRDEVRMVAGALRSGASFTAVRTRSHDSEDQVVASSGLVPDLEKSLLATFAPSA